MNNVEEHNKSRYIAIPNKNNMYFLFSGKQTPQFKLTKYAYAQPASVTFSLCPI